MTMIEEALTQTTDTKASEAEIKGGGRAKP